MHTTQRRAFVRIPAGLPIHYGVCDGQHRRVSTMTNLSRGGICFEGHRRFKPGTSVELTIDTAQGSEHFNSRVAWCRKEGGTYLTGVSFFGNEDATRARLVTQVGLMEAHYREQIARGREIDPESSALEWIQRYAHTVPEFV